MTFYVSFLCQPITSQPSFPLSFCTSFHYSYSFFFSFFVASNVNNGRLTFPSYHGLFVVFLFYLGYIRLTEYCIAVSTLLHCVSVYRVCFGFHVESSLINSNSNRSMLQNFRGGAAAPFAPLTPWPRYWLWVQSLCRTKETRLQRTQSLEFWHKSLHKKKALSFQSGKLHFVVWASLSDSISNPKLLGLPGWSSFSSLSTVRFTFSR